MDREWRTTYEIMIKNKINVNINMKGLNSAPVISMNVPLEKKFLGRYQFCDFG